MAVFTQLSDSEILEILSRFSISSVKQISGIVKGSENTNYFIESSFGKYVLTILEDRNRDENVPFILDMLAKLCEENIICPHIVSASSGQRRVVLESGKVCILQTFMDGEDTPTPTAFQCYAAGKTLANMHNACSKVKMGDLENPVSFDVLKEMNEELKNLPKAKEKPEVLALLQNEIDYLTANAPRLALPVGFIHGDYFKDNVLFTETFVSGVVDFWFSCVDYYVYDLAVALNAWGFEKGVFCEECLNSFYKGYTDRRSLTQSEKAALPYFLRLSSLRFLTTRFSDYVHGKSEVILANKPFQTWEKRLKYHQENSWNF